MIGWLEGELLEKHPGQVLVKVGGVGYQVYISLATFYNLPDPPASVALLIHTRASEDALELYGFLTREEKTLFLQLINIPRIGPRMAINILSGISPEEFAQALAASDLKRLSGIPGVGRKTGERIIVELKDRVPAPGGLLPPRAPGDQLYNDALSALVNLGYHKQQAEKALDSCRGQGADTLEELLRQSLKVMAR